MNGPFQVAQAGGTATSSTNGSPVRIYKLTKPLTDQAVMVNLGNDEKVNVDFSAIADENITLVHVGEKLIILFDNKSTVTVEPFFNSRADGLGGETRDEITLEMAPGRDISAKEFATLFPITTDTSVLPAEDRDGNSNANAQASGAYFSPFSVDPLDAASLNQLAPQEELGSFAIEIPIGGTSILGGPGGIVISEETPPPATLPINDDTPVANTVTAAPVLDDDAQPLFPGNPGGTGDVANATVATGVAGALFSAGADGLQSISFTNPIGLKAIFKDATGLAAQESLTYATTTAAGGHTILTATGATSGHTVFTLDVAADGSYTFTALAPLVSPTVGTTEENLPVVIGFTVTDGDGDTATGQLTVQVNDDTPTMSVNAAFSSDDDALTGPAILAALATSLRTRRTRPGCWRILTAPMARARRC